MIKIFKIKIFSGSKKEALEEVKKWLKSGGKKRYLVTPNPEILVRAQKDKKLAQILNQADLALPDGTGIIWAARFLGKKIRERITGVDFMESLCQMSQKEGFTIGLIGGGPGVAVKAAECLQKKYPGLRVVLAAEEWPDGGADARSLSAWPPTRFPRRIGGEPASLVPASGRFAPRVAHSVGLAQTVEASAEQLRSPRHSNLAIQPFSHQAIDLLFVAFGAPKQEEWISSHLKNLPVKVAMGVGGAFDYLSGVVPRAPKWVQKSGFEWLYRLIRQPWRVKRQRALLKFIFLVLKEKMTRDP